MCFYCYYYHHYFNYSQAHGCRERVQKHHQKLTRELTKGQLLRLQPRQTFVQQASFVLLTGHLSVKGQAAGMHAAFISCCNIKNASFVLLTGHLSVKEQAAGIHTALCVLAAVSLQRLSHNTERRWSETFPHTQRNSVRRSCGCSFACAGMFSTSAALCYVLCDGITLTVM